MSIFKDLFSGPAGAVAAVNNATLKEPEWWRQSLFNDNSMAGVTVTQDNAMTISAVYACVRILSETIAGLPLKIYEQVDGQQRVADHPLNFIFGGSANGEQTSFELREFQMVNLALRGNSYSHVIRRGGRVAAIEPLNAKFMNVDRDAMGRLVFDYQETGVSRVFSGADIWRVAGLGSNGVTGLSPISLAREGLGIAMATEGHAAKLFSNGAQIPGVLEFPTALKEDQINRLREQFANNNQGYKNAHKPLILESGMKYSSVGMSADDAQFLESRKYQMVDIARWFRVPPHKLGEMDRATFSNIEHQSIEFVVDTIVPWLVRLEQTISRDLLTANERGRLFAKHSVEGLLRGDTKTRYEAYGKAIQDGWMNRNEARNLENLNRVDGLDEFVLPMNISTISEREKELNNSVSNLMATKEIKALEREIDRLTPDEFAAWVPEFYHRHRQALIENLHAPADKINDYINARISNLIKNPVETVPSVLANAAKETEALGNE